MKAANNLKSLGKEISSKTGANENYSMDDFENLLQLSFTYSSIIGHIAVLDELEVKDENLDEYIEIIENVCFNDEG